MQILHTFLQNSTKQHPDKIALISDNDSYTYHELDDCVNAVANYLIHCGIEKGDRIAVMVPKCVELVISFLAASKVGAIFVPINYDDSSEKIYYFFKELKPSALIVHHRYLDLVHADIRDSIRAESVIVCGGDANASLTYPSWDGIVTESGSSPPQSPIITPDDVVYYNVTSGSTGLPKFALTTHANIYWNTRSSVETLKITGDDVHLCMFSAFMHPHELFARAIYTGGTAVLVDSVFPKYIARSIEQHKVTCVMGLASLYEMLLEYADSGKFDMASLRLPESGGMHTKIPLLREFHNKMGARIIPVWGSTETTGIAIANEVDGELREGSLGKPCKYYEAKVVNDEWEETADMEIGELVFEGPGVVSGYANATSTNFHNKWYFSKDLAKRDKDGFIYFVDRKTGMLKSGGMKVFPMEIEIVLMNHPNIREVAVVGTVDDLRGEVPKAIIVPKTGKAITEREVKTYCRQHLSRFKIPRVIEFAEQLPKLPNGKVNRNALAGVSVDN